MLKNASSLAIVGLDTAENGPSKVRQVTNRIEAIIVADCGLERRRAEEPRGEDAAPRHRQRSCQVLEERSRQSEVRPPRHQPQQTEQT